MPYNFKYTPAFRSRQQELLVLGSFNFEERIFPLIEIIKEKDRVNNSRPISEIWLSHINAIKASKVLVDLPVYIKDTTSMPTEVVSFNRTTLSNLERRIEFFSMLEPSAQKVIPVVSSLLNKTGETDSITNQIIELRKIFPSVAVRTFTNSLDSDVQEIQDNLTAEDILIYDLDTVQPLSPYVKKQMKTIEGLGAAYKVVIRSAINTEIQNVKLDHGEVVADADNSLIDLFQTNLHMNAFGDYVGIKKDDMGAGGTISPGFIFYDPIDNLYYGYKGEIKNLAEFENTIVPAVLNSEIVERLSNDDPQFISEENYGYKLLLKIQSGEDSGKSQAKFKRISMEHYLHCIREKIRAGDFD